MTRGAKDEFVEISGLVEHETERAMLVVFEGLPGVKHALKHWLPRSQMQDIQRSGPQDEKLTCKIPEWLANEKGLI